MDTRAGEEFRDDVRKKLPADVLAPLTQLDAWQSMASVVYTVGLLGVIIGLGINYWS